MSDVKTLKKAICEIGDRIYKRGFAAANDGNISIRLDQDRILCTPTQTSKGMLHVDDLIICDLMMPGFNGFDVLKALRGHAATLHVPIIIITGIRDDYVFRQILDTGASAYLPKPFTRDALFGVISSVI